MGGLAKVGTSTAKLQTPDAGVANFVGEVILSTSYDIIDENGMAIGFITNFSPTDARPATKIREINSATAGRVKEHAPGVSDITISVTGFALYNRQEDGSVVQRLGASSTKRAMKMLSEQHLPFKVLEVDRDPQTGKAVDATMHYDCWLTNHSKPVAIGTATVAETATISVGGAYRPTNYLTL